MTRNTTVVLAALAAGFLGFSPPLDAGTVPLVGITTVVPQANASIHFSPNALTVLSDGLFNAGPTFTSNLGRFAPDVTYGFYQSYDFDVSHYASISSIKFTWTGTETWDGDNPFPALRLGAHSGIAAAVLNPFGTGTQPTHATGTQSLVLTADASDFWYDLAYSLHDSLATFMVETDFGSGNLPSLSMQTFEVSADVTGVFVPEPATWVLAAIALATLGVLGIRRLRTKGGDVWKRVEPLLQAAMRPSATR